MDSALKCLVLAARQHGIETTVEKLKREQGITDPEVSFATLTRIAGEHGLDTRTERLDWPALLGCQGLYPALVKLRNGFFVLVVAMRGGDAAAVQVLDPLAAQAELVWIDRERFEHAYAGQAMLIKPRELHAGNPAETPFGWRWFANEMALQKPVFVQVIVVALALQILAFAPAIFSQVVFDKVITYGSLDTLHVLFAGVVMALLFNGLFGGIRSLLLLYATSRLDMRAASYSFQKLLRLPLGLFQQVSAGTLVKHIQQTGQVREFFTGNLLLTLIELLALVVVLPILFFFSWQLSCIVIVFSLAIAANTLFGARSNREKLMTLYETEAQRQSVLTETVHGIETVKSMALEPYQGRHWLDLTAHAARLQFQVGRRAIYTGEVSQLLMKLMYVVVIWAGTLLLFEHQVTAGTLIAFNILSARVTGPLVQMVQLLTKFQQTAISLDMLAKLLNRPGERTRQGGLTPDVRGEIDFAGVGFTYPGAGRPALEDVKLHVQAGRTLGVVGRSGSGKSTLIRLLLGLDDPSRGLVRIDGHDVREYDISHLRAQIGVVTQRTVLFRGTVRENIAKARQWAGMDEVVAAAKLANAHEFIEQLPRGYDTVLEEDAANLSGGQKQRLALARALLANPRILVLDEATSALDPESEAMIRQQLPQIARGRTLIQVSHRLSMLTSMDAIAVLDNGRLVDLGPHATLLRRCALYRKLWTIQNPHEAER
ncbi:peptidase domain-containing ABC transporter [Chitinimonas koreensis]|uniref:peptidase domain-containing ABC transporter n=1 Tax=Chitinimonas koreensis TaxID=356302 RepID=UPI00040D6A71|nr:peptidase domain-containing ABC transporter [Chitinimonas koreensis]QNM98298.1 peptidase domain-containing ABC transporter [Chitinimonas koreensis]